MVAWVMVLMAAGIGVGFGGFGYNPAFLGGWAFNPIFGMYTYLPYSGFGYSPFGYTYYSPNTVGLRSVLMAEADTPTAAAAVLGRTRRAV